MNIRDLISNLDAIEAHTTGNPVNAVDSLDAHPVAVEIEPVDATEVSVMVPPLQASLELLKKVSDEPSVYTNDNSGCGCDSPCDCSDSDYVDEKDDELDDIKRFAGIAPVAIVAQSI